MHTQGQEDRWKISVHFFNFAMNLKLLVKIIKFMKREKEYL